MLTAQPRGPFTLAALAPPMVAREATTLPRGEDWIYEFLWGGERVRAVKWEGGVHLLARDGRDLTNRFPRITAAVAKLRASAMIIDGEILYLDSYPEATTRFLAQVVDEALRGGLALLAYDLICDDGRDVRQYSLLYRRLLLASVVQGAPIILAPVIQARCGAALLAAARLGFRGVVAKRAGSPYHPNSLASDWVKTTFASPASDSRAGFRASATRSRH